MKYNKKSNKNIYSIILIIISIIMILFIGYLLWQFLNKTNENYSNDRGPIPSDTRWSRNSDDNEQSDDTPCKNLNTVDYIKCIKQNPDAASYFMKSSGPCITQLDGIIKYGLFVDGNICVPLDKLKELETSEEHKQQEEEEGKKENPDTVASNFKIPMYTGCLPPDTNFNTVCQVYEPTFNPILIENCNTPLSYKRALCGLNTSCYNKNTNFEKVCKDKYDDTYGVYELNPCQQEEEQRDKYRATCAKNYINGRMVDFDKKTPCIDKNLDFNDMCKYYVPNDSIETSHWGARSILNGQDGGCYKQNGNNQDIPDDTKSAAICGSNYESTIPVFGPFFQNQNYNVFTDCKPLNSNFRRECSKKLKYATNNTYAIDIMGYDCNPQYARAKCIDLNHIPKPDPSIAKLIDDIYPDPTN